MMIMITQVDGMIGIQVLFTLAPPGVKAELTFGKRPQRQNARCQWLPALAGPGTFLFGVALLLSSAGGISPFRPDQITIIFSRPSSKFCASAAVGHVAASESVFQLQLKSVEQK